MTQISRTVAVLALATLLGFTVGCIANAGKSTINVAADTPKATSSESPEKPWAPIYMSAIQKRLQGTDIVTLRSAPIDPESIEVRVWGGSSGPLKGVILTRSKTASTATLLEPRDYENVSPCIARGVHPKNGWETFWGEFDKAQIAYLEDPVDIAKIDEVSLVVEIKQGEAYHSYKYSGVSKCKGGHYLTLFKFNELMEREFNVNLLTSAIEKSELCETQ